MKQQLQRNTLTLLASLAPEVITVVFGKSSYEKEFGSLLRFDPSPE